MTFTKMIQGNKFACLAMSVYTAHYIDSLVQDCSNSIANALELLQSCTKPTSCT